jgi:hypothetical protein
MNLGLRPRVIWPMWWRQNPDAMSEENRQAEIRRLERVRDKLLADAPKHFHFRRFLIPIMLALALWTVVNALLQHRVRLGSGLFLAAFCAVLMREAYRLWIRPPSPGDRWGYSDTLGYEGDSPRDVQKKIDVLRASSSEGRVERG